MRAGTLELILIVAVAFVVFGKTLIPKLMGNIRQNGKILKEEAKKTKEEFSSEEDVKKEA